jgi:hypothetical protein
LSKNEIAWVSITAKHQKAPLKTFGPQRWFLTSGWPTLFDNTQSVQTSTRFKFKNLSCLSAQEDSLDTRFFENCDGSTGSRQLRPSNVSTKYDAMFGSEDSAGASHRHFPSGDYRSIDEFTSALNRTQAIVACGFYVIDCI